MRKGSASAFYTKDWKIKREINAGRCTRFFKIVLVVDGANEIMSAKAALDGFVGDQTDVACLSFDDFVEQLCWWNLGYDGWSTNRNTGDFTCFNTL